MTNEYDYNVTQFYTDIHVLYNIHNNDCISLQHSQL